MILANHQTGCGVWPIGFQPEFNLEDHVYIEDNSHIAFGKKATLYECEGKLYPQYKGVKKSLPDWSKLKEVNYSTAHLYIRIKTFDSIEEALFNKPMKQVKFAGLSDTQKEEITILLAKGVAQVEITKNYPVSKTTISHYAKYLREGL